MSTNFNLLTAIASSTYAVKSGSEWPPFNVLDGLHGIKCGEQGKFYNSNNEANPWLEVTWSGTITIQRIVIYNRFDCCGKYW